MSIIYPDHWAFETKGLSLFPSCRKEGDFYSEDTVYSEVYYLDKLQNKFLKDFFYGQKNMTKVKGYICFKLTSLLALPLNTLALIKALALAFFTLPLYRTSYSRYCRTSLKNTSLHFAKTLRRQVFEAEYFIRKAIKLYEANQPKQAGVDDLCDSDRYFAEVTAKL